MFDIILVIVLLFAVGALLTENSLYLIKRRASPIPERKEVEKAGRHA